MADTWAGTTPGLLQLPSGRMVRGRGLRRPLPDGQRPEFGLYLTGRPPRISGWPSRWLRWPDFWLPLDRDEAVQAIHEAWTHSAARRVEIACGGGVGRTGTALACLAVLDGLSGRDAVDYVRRNYSPRAVETPWQRRYVGNFRP
ncbi:protein-tyrosine phosphatase family protein [Arthrobacter livingstonensis]|nr:protein-tyrosine phosphatase family protein [Arthrobacter livingstonensis]